MKIKILQPFIGNVDGKSVRFVEGEIHDVPENTADDFVRGKYAEYITNIPAVKVINKPKALNTRSMKG